MTATWDILVATVGGGAITHFALPTTLVERLETYCGAEGRTMARGSTRVYPSAVRFVSCKRCIEAVRRGWARERWTEHLAFIEEPTYD